jgi:hypothetical protein
MLVKFGEINFPKPAFAIFWHPVKVNNQKNKKAPTTVGAL